MPGPLDSLRFIHTALDREIAELEALVASVAAPADALALRERFDFLERLCDGHTRGEEEGLFPDLDEKLPGLSKTYLFDHGDERTAFVRIRRLLDACAKGDPDAVAPLVREVNKLTDHLARHIRKENELVLPLVEEYFSEPEQATMIERVVGVFTQTDMASVVPFIVAWLDPEDRVRYINVLACALPELAFRGLAARIRGRLDDASWAALVESVPALA